MTPAALNQLFNASHDFVVKRLPEGATRGDTLATVAEVMRCAASRLAAIPNFDPMDIEQIVEMAEALEAHAEVEGITTAPDGLRLN